MKTTVKEKAGAVEPLVKPFWLSWTAKNEHGAWTIHSPWWISGYEIFSTSARYYNEDPIVCAAVMADRLTSAKEYIRLCHDNPPPMDEIAWRFIEEKPQGWSPFSDRFPKADWMKWV